MKPADLQNIRLRDFIEEDKIPLAEYCNNKKIHDNLRDTIPFPYHQSDADNFINFSRKEKPKMNFAIEYEGGFAGVIGLALQTDVYRYSAEIGYWLAEPFWGKGIATRSVELMLEYGFGILNLHRIYSSVFEYNLASRKVMEKTGFELEGIFKSSVFKNGKFHNEYRFARLNPNPIL